MRCGFIIYSQTTCCPFFGKLEVFVKILMPLPQDELAGLTIQSLG